ncbi:LuxR C-terminal-related transcriptional regulator [Streptomyces wuyuanensis]|uniref:LuxR C-terminal-related transcriptional regulator n=1 Tax=Streptomyces wuyuanensis TaxID=1196353 RepID=UPI00342497C8
MNQPLSPRQMHFLARVAEGQTMVSAGRELGLAAAAAEDYGKKIKAKLGARTMPHAVLLACRAGLLDGKPRRHGDHAGFAAHVYRGEDPWACTQGCPEGERAYRAERRRARREAKAPAA